MLAFWIVGGIGAVALLISFIVGDLFDGLFDGVDVTGGFLSTAALAGFAAAFGLGGGIAASMGASMGVAIAIGIAAGVAVGLITGLTTKFVASSPTDRAPGADDVIGSQGVVVSTIGDGSLGEILIRVGGHRLKYNARSDSGAIPVGADVVVTASLSSTSVRVRAL